MSKRYLELTPTELTKLNKQDFLDGVRTSEGRVVGAYVCPFAPNYIEKVSNPELVASFGADYITLEGYNPRDLQIPGLPSKDTNKDGPYKEQLQVEMGFGWTIPELKKLTGRPIGMILLVPKDKTEMVGGIYENSVYSLDMVSYLIREDYDFICLCGYDQTTLIEAVVETKKMYGDQIVIEAGIPHGPGNIKGDFPSYNLREMVTPKFVGELAKAGADIIDIPAIGIVPGFTVEYVTRIVDTIHEGKALAASSIAHSLEASSITILERIILDNKICGVDMFNVAAGGVYESVTLPESLQGICIAVKGKRHTYRRMAQSPLR